MKKATPSVGVAYIYYGAFTNKDSYGILIETGILLRLFGGDMQYKESLKILSVGNSFAVDTTKHLADVTRSVGVDDLLIGTLYIGGCSINRHFRNAQENAPAYKYYTNRGEGWTHVEGVSIKDAVESDDWDFISIQHGTGDGSRYTQENSYENLPALVSYIRSIAPEKARIVFNMAWVMEPDGTHPEIRSYGGDQFRMYQSLVGLTERVVLPIKGIDLVSPTGTAVQNARATALAGKLCRDGFHLSRTLGRFLAAVTFLHALTGISIDQVRFLPEDVTEEEKQIAIECAKRAVKDPFRVTVEN